MIRYSRTFSRSLTKAQKTTRPLATCEVTQQPILLLIYAATISGAAVKRHTRTHTRTHALHGSEAYLQPGGNPCLISELYQRRAFTIIMIIIVSITGWWPLGVRTSQTKLLTLFFCHYFFFLTSRGGARSNGARNRASIEF